MTHKGAVSLVTEQLLLHRFTLQDADAMFRTLYSETDAMRHLPWDTHTSISETETHLAGYIAGYENNAYQGIVCYH